MHPPQLAPIVLLTYNRPAHTRRTVEALARNRLADGSDLIIYSDGPKDVGAAGQVDEVRRYLRSVSGFKSVCLVEREYNVGLAESVVSGVTQACARHGKVIVVEDDLVTSDRFLEFMNNALNKYARDERVMHISGYMYPIDHAGLPETFFLPPASCWGWATWESAWRHFSKDAARLTATFSISDRRKFNLDNSFPYWTQVRMNAEYEINTWAIFWYASVFERGGVCLHPRESYVQNIGHDDSGQHSDVSKNFDVVLNQSGVDEWASDAAIDGLALKRLQHFFRSTLSWRSRVKLRLASLSEFIERARSQ
jgi:GT2 family glycosyltransferase